MTQRQITGPVLQLSPLAATIMLFTTPAAAQAPRAAPVALDEIIVTATRMDTTLARVPAAVSVVGKDAIQLATQQLALDESLSRVPGLFMQNRYNFAQDLRVSIRGFGARANFGIRGVKILVDGIPETLPDGQGSVDGIDIGSTQQIEVLRGPSSTLYGNASGGVIAVTTEAPPEELSTDIRLSVGEYGFRKVQLKAGGRGERVGYLVSLSDTELDGYREQSRAENTQLTGRFDFDLGDDRTLLTVVNLTDQPISDDPGGVDATQAALDPRSARDLNVAYDAGEFLEQSRVGFVYSMPVGDNGSLSARNYYVWRDFGNALPFTAGGIVELDRFYAGGGISYSYDGFFLDRPNQLVIGVDFDSQDDDRTRFDNNFGTRGALTFDQNESVSSRGVFLQNELALTENLELTLGLRFDEIEFDVTDRFLGDGDDSGKITFDDTSPMVGLSFRLTDNLNLYGTYSTAFESPTTTEFNRPDGTGGFNEALRPQTAENIEFGLRGSAGGNRHRYEVAVFDIAVDDELIPFEVPGSPGRDYFENAVESSRKGIEFSLISRPTETLTTTLTYTYSDFEFDAYEEFSANTIPGTAENVLFAEIAYESPRGWFGILDLLHIGDQFANNANTDVNDAYTLSNLRFGFENDLGGATLTPFLGINNLFDETYNANVRVNAFGARYFEPGPERNLYAGVNVRFNFR
jgi:iron complex outermembrane recepter protein